MMKNYQKNSKIAIQKNQAKLKIAMNPMKNKKAKMRIKMKNTKKKKEKQKEKMIQSTELKMPMK